MSLWKILFAFGPSVHKLIILCTCSQWNFWMCFRDCVCVCVCGDISRLLPWFKMAPLPTPTPPNIPIPPHYHFPNIPTLPLPQYPHTTSSPISPHYQHPQYPHATSIPTTHTIHTPTLLWHSTYISVPAHCQVFGEDGLVLLVYVWLDVVELGYEGVFDPVHHHLPTYHQHYMRDQHLQVTCNHGDNVLLTKATIVQIFLHMCGQ